MAKRKTRAYWSERTLPKKEIEATFPPIFQPFLTESARWKICHGGRGGGKTESIAKALLLLGKQQPLRVLCCRETMSSIKQSSHQVLASMIGILGLEDYYTVERDRIYGQYVDVVDPETNMKKKKRTEFFFIGLRDLNVSAVKSYFDIQIAWLEEAQSISKHSLRILEPTIRRAQGSDPNAPSEIWVSFNPTYEHDAVYQLIQDPPEDSIIVPMNWRDNPWFDQSGLRRSMEEMKKRNYDEYMHVWEGNPLRYWEGQVYLNELKQMEAEGRICDVPYHADAECQVVFDIGGGRDATALWIMQCVGDYLHFIDYHEKVQSSLDYFLRWIENRPYVITKYWLPHDARQRHAGMDQSYEALIRARGKKVQVIPGGAGSVAEGINAVRTLANRMKIDKEKCAKGIEALRNYRFEIESDQKGTFKSVPVHDKFSHGCLAADSVVDTKCGTKRIDAIVPGDFVWTPAGYAEVTWAGRVKLATELVELETSDGRVLRCTPEHKVATKRGFLPADVIRYSDSLLTGFEFPCHLIGLLSRVTHIGFRAIITGEMSGAATDPATCIGRFGRTRTDRFLQGCTSTIKMVIHSTTNWPILNWSSALRTCVSTPSPGGKLEFYATPQNIVANELKNGIAQRPVMPFMWSTASTVWRSGDGIRAFARNVVKRLCHRILSVPSSATSTVKCRTCAVAGEAVYDLTVKNHACYRANGILVSNSDCMRYACMAYKMAKETKIDTAKYYNRSPFRGDAHGWMTM